MNATSFETAGRLGAAWSGVFRKESLDDPPLPPLPAIETVEVGRQPRDVLRAEVQALAALLHAPRPAEA